MMFLETPSGQAKGVEHDFGVLVQVILEQIEQHVFLERTPTESWQEGDFRSYWKDLLPKWLEFRHSVDGGIVVTVEILGRQYPSKSNRI